MYLQRGFYFIWHLSIANLMGLFKFAGTVKIRGFETVSICKSREGGYRVNYGNTLKLAGRRRLYGV
jgi:hypothetical protein